MTLEQPNDQNHNHDEPSDWFEKEYDRAVSDYRRLVRHRLANPLTIILGASLTLRDKHVSDDMRKQLCTEIILASQRLERELLDPLTLTAEERTLQPFPKYTARRNTDERS